MLITSRQQAMCQFDSFICFIIINYHSLHNILFHSNLDSILRSFQFYAEYDTAIDEMGLHTGWANKIFPNVSLE